MNIIVHISVYYQSLITNESFPIGKTFQVHNVTKDEAIQKVIQYLYKTQYEEHIEEGETIEDFKHYFTVIPEGDTPIKEFEDEEGYVLQIVNNITL